MFIIFIWFLIKTDKHQTVSTITDIHYRYNNASFSCYYQLIIYDCNHNLQIQTQ